MLRYSLSGRWIAWHLICLILVAFMVGMGVWQWLVATSPAEPGGPPDWNPRNLVYALQWWVFAVFGGWFWYRYLRDQRDEEAMGAADAKGPADDSGGEPSPQMQISLDAPAAVRLSRNEQYQSDVSREREVS